MAVLIASWGCLLWVFVSASQGFRFPGGVFSTRERAEEWIREHRLSGTLTLYPVDVGVLRAHRT